MVGHKEKDKLSLLLAHAVAEKVDRNPELLDQVRCWAAKHNTSAYREWQIILSEPWAQIRKVLLQDNEEGRRLRQSSPFVGVLTPQERWKFFPVG